MNNLIKHDINFYTVEELILHKKNDDKLALKNIGISIDGNIILSQVLFHENKIKNTPYELYVDKESYDITRLSIVDYLIDLAIEKSQLGQSATTINTKIIKTIRFINWCNINYRSVTHNKKHARSALSIYSNYLRKQIRNNNIAKSTANRQQTYAYELLIGVFNDKYNNMFNGLKFIKVDRDYSSSMTASKIDDIAYHFNFYVKTFNTIADFILKNENFPLKLNLSNKIIWCLPSSKFKYITSKENSPKIFDYELGNFLDISDYAKSYETYSIENIKKNIYYWEQALKYNNENNRTLRRFALAEVALKAYFIYFLHITGMNDSTAATLEWNHDFLLDKKSQKLKTIKYRAGNKAVEFEINNKFIPDFKKFISLRYYLLEGRNFKWLFFYGHGKKAKLSNIQKSGSFSSEINNFFIKRFDSDLPNMTSKQLRVNKTHQVIKSDGVIAASKLAQNSISTLLTHYLGNTDESNTEQMTAFFNQFNKNVFLKKPEDYKEINIGHCTSINNVSITVNTENIDFIDGCKKAEGCLFCEHYRIHSDDTDIRKLYSLMFIIYEYKHIAKDEKHFEKFYSLILKRIENIIQEIIKFGIISKSKIELIKTDVFENENLDRYWMHKYHVLVNAGVLI